MHILRKAFYLFLVFFFILLTYQLKGQNYYYTICPEDLVAFQPEVPPVIIGCELANCCPVPKSKVPDINKITLHMEVELEGQAADFITSIKLGIKDYPALSPNQGGITVDGNIKFNGKDTLELGRGRSTADNFRVTPRYSLDALPTKLFVLAKVDDRKMDKIYKEVEARLDSISKGKSKRSLPESLGKLTFTIIQKIDQYTVNEFKIHYDFIPCFGKFLADESKPNQRTRGLSNSLIGDDPELLVDTLQLINNVKNDRAVVWTDGRLGEDCENNILYREKGTFTITNLLNGSGTATRGPCIEEVVVFSNNNAIYLSPTVWEDAANEKEELQLAGSWQPPVNLVIAMPSNVSLENQIKHETLLSKGAFNTNHAGITFIWEENLTPSTIASSSNREIIRDAAILAFGDPATETPSNCSAAIALLQDLPLALRPPPNTINIYYVDLPKTGIACPDNSGAYNIIFIGNDRQPETITHELGHAFSLNHIPFDLDTLFASNNYMRPTIENRRNFTEGQVFRMTFDPFSALNKNGTRKGIIRDCADVPENDDVFICPCISLDIAPNY